ncbi:unnamed protein product [Chrysoparadoxa australica]
MPEHTDVGRAATMIAALIEAVENVTAEDAANIVDLLQITTAIGSKLREPMNKGWQLMLLHWVCPKILKLLNIFGEGTIERDELLDLQAFISASSGCEKKERPRVMPCRRSVRDQKGDAREVTQVKKIVTQVTPPLASRQ